jgi:hypothetical protein
MELYSAILYYAIMSEKRQLKKTGIALFSILAIVLIAGTGSVGNFVQNAYAANTLTINGYALDGRPLNMWIVIQQNGATVKTGFTPLTFAGTTGTTYSVQAQDYTAGNIFFDHWENGSTNRARSVTLSSDVSITAFYTTTAPSSSTSSTVNTTPSTYALTVNSMDMYGKAVNGLWTVISASGSTVKTGFTPLSFAGSAGTTYSVTVSDYSSTLFDHWQDNGSTVRAKSVTLNANTTITAVFRVPTVTISPTSGVAGTSIIVSGTYFTPNNSTVTITYDGQSVGSSATTTNAAGAFTASFNAPALGTGFHKVQAVDGGGWKASTVFQDTTPPPPSPLAPMLPKTGVYVPLYMYPSGDGATQWQTVYDQKVAHPSVPIVATFNPNSGPGTSKDMTIAIWVAKLRSVHVIMIGYTYDSYGTRSLTDFKTDAGNYKNWYNTDGIFIDEFTNQVGYESHYSSITSYVKSIGMNMTMGNPGTDVPKSYVGTADVLNITEGQGYMPISWLQYCVQCSADQGWHYQYDKRYFSYTRYNVTSLDTTFETNSSQWVGLLYITNGNDSNGRWFTLPSYFGTEVAALDR